MVKSPRHAVDPAEEARETVRHVDLAAETALWTRQAPGLSATKGFVNQPSTWLWRTQGQCGPARHVGPARRVLLWTRHARGSSPLCGRARRMGLAHKGPSWTPTGMWVRRRHHLRGLAKRVGPAHTMDASDMWLWHTQCLCGPAKHLEARASKGSPSTSLRPCKKDH